MEKEKIKIRIKKGKGLPPKAGKSREALDVLVRSIPQMTDMKSSKEKDLAPIVQIKRPKKRFDPKSFFIGLLIIVLGLILGLGLAWFGYHQFWARKDTLINLVPEEVFFYGWIDLEMFKGKDRDLDKYLYHRLDEALKPFHLTFKDDTEPILGNQLAFIASNQDKNSLALIAEIRNLDKAHEALDKFTRDLELRGEVYEGVRIIEVKSVDPKEFTVSYAFLKPKKNIKTFYKNLLRRTLILAKARIKIRPQKLIFGSDYLVLGSDLDLVKRIIDVCQGRKISLEDQPDFKKTVSKLSLRPLAYFFVKPEEFLSLARSFPNLESKSLFGLEISQFFSLTQILAKDTKSIALAINVFDEGFKIESMANLPQRYKNFRSELIGLVPSEVAVLISGHNLKNEMEDLEKKLVSYSPFYAFHLSDLETNLKDRFGINLKDDLLSWMTEEWAFVLLPENDQTFKWGIAFKLDEVELVKEKLKKIEKAMETYYSHAYPIEKEITLEDGTKATELLPDMESYKFSDVELEGIKIRTMDSPRLKESFSYTFIDNKLIIGTQEAVMAIRPNQDLSGTINLLPEENIGLVYLDISKVCQGLGVPEEIRADLKALKSFVMASISSEEGVFSKGFLLVQ